MRVFTKQQSPISNRPPMNRNIDANGGRKITFAFAVALCVQFLFSPIFASASTVHVEDATVVMPVKSARVMAGYAKLINQTLSTVTLTAISSDAFERVEIHKSIIENDVAKMRKVSALAISPHGSLALEQGGLHLMLMRPTSELDVGDPVTLEFSFDNGETQFVIFNVVSLSQQDAKKERGTSSHDNHSDNANSHSNHTGTSTTSQ